MDAKIQNELDVISDIIVKTVPVDQIYLFGSYAYGTPNEDSDLDIYVVLKDGEKNPLLVMEDVYWNIAQSKKIKKSLDIMGQYRSIFENRCHISTLEKTVTEKGVLLYDRK